MPITCVGVSTQNATCHISVSANEDAVAFCGTRENADFCSAAFEAAIALEKKGHDALEVMKNLPEIVNWWKEWIEAAQAPSKINPLREMLGHKEVDVLNRVSRHAC